MVLPRWELGTRLIGGQPDRQQAIFEYPDAIQNMRWNSTANQFEPVPSNETTTAKEQAASPLTPKASQELAPRDFWTTFLSQATETGSMPMRLQEVRDGNATVVGYEALLGKIDGKWPNEAVPLLKELGLGYQLDLAMIGSVVSLLSQHSEISNIAVNIESRSLNNPALPEYVETILSRYGVTPERLSFEITETSELPDMAIAVPVLEVLHMAGHTLKIDDFGVGHSREYLAALPEGLIDVVKIDIDYVRPIQLDPGSLLTENPNNRIVLPSRAEIFVDPVLVANLQQTVNAFHENGVKVVAEGVETPELAELLVTRVGVDQLQGFGLHKPQPVGEVDFKKQLKSQGENTPSAADERRKSSAETSESVVKEPSQASGDIDGLDASKPRKVHSTEMSEHDPAQSPFNAFALESIRQLRKAKGSWLSTRVGRDLNRLERYIERHGDRDHYGVAQLAADCGVVLARSADGAAARRRILAMGARASKLLTSGSLAAKASDGIKPQYFVVDARGESSAGGRAVAIGLPAQSMTVKRAYPLAWDGDWLWEMPVAWDGGQVVAIEASLRDGLIVRPLDDGTQALITVSELAAHLRDHLSRQWGDPTKYRLGEEIKQWEEQRLLHALEGVGLVVLCMSEGADIAGPLAAELGLPVMYSTGRDQGTIGLSKVPAMKTELVERRQPTEHRKSETSALSEPSHLERHLIGEAVKTLRLHRGMTQLGFAELTGISAYTLKRIEKHLTWTSTTAATFRKLVEALGYSVPESAASLSEIVLIERHHLGAGLRMLRQRCGLTITELAQQVGVSRHWIDAMERTTAPLQDRTGKLLHKVAEVLGGNLEDFIAASQKMPNQLREVGKRIKTWREDRGWSHYQLGKRVGAHGERIVRLENGTLPWTPGLDQFVADVAEALGRSPIRPVGSTQGSIIERLLSEPSQGL